MEEGKRVNQEDNNIGVVLKGQGFCIVTYNGPGRQPKQTDSVENETKNPSKL